MMKRYRYPKNQTEGGIKLKTTDGLSFQDSFSFKTSPAQNIVAGRYLWLRTSLIILAIKGTIQRDLMFFSFIGRTRPEYEPLLVLKIVLGPPQFYTKTTFLSRKFSKDFSFLTVSINSRKLFRSFSFYTLD